jgi:murein DD-endopeptidase MepM/ murein hydrolase activator NlpD
VALALLSAAGDVDSTQEVEMVRRPSLGLALVLVLTALSLAGCREAAVRYNARYATLMQEELPKTLPIPVDGVLATQLQNTWGFARDGGRHHKGIDIFAPRNTPIRSVTAGVVENKGMRGLGGQVVTITGPGGYRFYYAHLEEYGPQEPGDWVEAGEIIGYVGNSGNAAISSTHLHYGIYAPSGEAINPYPLLRRGQPFPAQPAAQTQTAAK